LFFVFQRGQHDFLTLRTGAQIASVADSQNIAIRPQARPEFFAEVATCACEQKSRKFEGAGWRIEHGFLSSNRVQVSLAFEALGKCCGTVAQYVLIGTNRNKQAALSHVMFGQSFIARQNARRFARGFDADGAAQMRPQAYLFVACANGVFEFVVNRLHEGVSLEVDL
jgi:hypothetical protein